MAIHVALNHKTSYRYDQLVNLGPQVVRLRPAPHCRTPILSYSLKITPREHFLNWQQDPQSNHQARLVFPERTREFVIEVDLVAEIAAMNPFDFFLESTAEESPFTYEPWLLRELRPYLETEAPGPALKAWLATVDREPIKTIDFAGGVNVTLGLPFVRTSPDHGTALDIAGTGRADPASLLAALAMATEMAGRRTV